MARLLVIGGGPAGMAAASKAKREKPDLEVIVAEAGKYVSFALCGIPYYLAGVVKDINELVHYTPEYFREKRKIDVRIKTKVTSVDFSGKKAILEYENGREEEVEWDYLVIATGAKPRTFPLPGLDLEGIYTIRSLDDAVIIKEAAKKAEKVVIVGGGYIGLEVAEAFRILGKKVTVIEALDHVLPNVDKDIADYVEEELRRNGIEIKKEQKVVGFEGNGKVRKVLTEKGEYEADLVIFSVGVVPNTDLFRDSPLEFGFKGAIRVNERMETNIEGVYAVGDVATVKNIVTGKEDWIALAQIANKMGRVAGANIAGLEMSLPGVAGTAFIKVFDLEVGRTGLTEFQAKKLGYNVESIVVKSVTKPKYYPGWKNIVVKILYDSESKKILGAQAVGGEGVSMRINAIATALYAKLTVDELFNIDFGYAPPFAPVWDPLVVASSLALRRKKV